MYVLKNREEIWSAQSLNRLSLIGFLILRYRLCLLTRDECGTSCYIMSAITHTMVKGLSRCKFAAVNFYSGLLFQGDLRLYVTLFTSVEFRFHAIIFPGNTWRTFTASGIFGLIKTVDIEDKKNNNNNKKKRVVAHVVFLKFQNQVNKRVNLPCKKIQTFAQIIGHVSKLFQAFFWRQFWNSNLQNSATCCSFGVVGKKGAS